jgi:hypothetical protein
MRGLLLAPLFLAAVGEVHVLAQDNPNEIPLGDLARTLRKKSPPTQPVIDDDNLPQMMNQAANRRAAGSVLRFLTAGERHGFQVSAPDATCSLAYTSKVKSLLSGQYSQKDLPDELVGKLQGKATIEGDSFTLPVFNGTDWHVSELDVALTVVRKPGRQNPLGIGETLLGAEDETSALGADPLQQVRPEKKADVTVIYKMRAASPPWERAVFIAPLDVDLQPGDEWHWAIVQAKGYPPESYASTTPQTAAKENGSEIVNPSIPSPPAAPKIAVSASSAASPQ